MINECPDSAAVSSSTLCFQSHLLFSTAKRTGIPFVVIVTMVVVNKNYG